MVCQIEGCVGQHVAKGYCRKHYTRLVRYGDPHHVTKGGWKLDRAGKPIQIEVTPSGCHICTSHVLDKDGYPKIFRDGQTLRMSRYVYEQNFGKIPDGLVIRHKCDTPPCINPEHLELGTYQDNSDDKVSRGRASSLPGEKNPMAKLTTADVIKIRRLIKQGYGDTYIGDRFGVSRKCIAKIRTGETWKHVKEV